MCSIGALDAQARWSTSQRTRCTWSSTSTRTGTHRGQARQNCVRRKTSSTSRWPCEARQKVVRRKLVLWSSDSYDLLNTIWSLMYTFWFLCASSGSYGFFHHPWVKVVIGLWLVRWAIFLRCRCAHTCKHTYTHRDTHIQTYRHRRTYTVVRMISANWPWVD